MAQYPELTGDFLWLQQKLNKAARGLPPHSGVPHDIENRVEHGIARFVTTLGLQNAPVVSTTTQFLDDESADPIAVLAGLKLIDTSGLSWAKIMDFRRDKESQDKVRRLRLFAHANYAGKSRAYVEDHILTQIDDYEAVAKLWGFNTKEGIFNISIDPKAIGGTGIAALGSALMDAPMTALVAAGVGTAIQIGRASIFFQKQRYAWRNVLRDNPVSFIATARMTLKR